MAIPSNQMFILLANYKASIDMTKEQYLEVALSKQLSQQDKLSLTILRTIEHGQAVQAEIMWEILKQLETLNSQNKYD